MKIGDKVKVIKPSIHSHNEKNMIGYITEIKNVFLEGFGECIGYAICKNKKCNHENHKYGSLEYYKQGWIEHESGIEVVK